MSIARTLSKLERQAVSGPAGLAAWCETYGKIQDKEFEIKPLKLNPLQRDFCRAIEYCLSRDLPIRLILLKPRQKGCSTISMAAAYWMMRRSPAKMMVIGGLKEQSGNLWEILQRYNEHDSFDWGEAARIGEEEAKFGNGSIARKGTAKNPESCRSATLKILIGTEVARWAEDGVANAEKIITGAMASVPKLPGTMVILESTARGPSGLFYKRWQRSVSLEDLDNGVIPDPGQFIRIFSPWHVHADSSMPLSSAKRAELQASLTHEEKDDQSRWGLTLEQIYYRRITTENDCEGDPVIFRREYPFTPAEAFAASNPSYFNSVSLTKMRRKAEASPPQPGLLHMDPGNKRVAFVPTELRSAMWWQLEPPMPERRYLIAADFMEGAAVDQKGDDRDHHAVMVMRDSYYDTRGYHPPRIVARTAWPCRWDLDIVEDVIEAASRLYGNCVIVPENNKDGGVIRNLLKRGLHVHQQIKGIDTNGDAVSPKPSGVYGFRTTGGEGEGTRKAILAELQRAIRQMDDIGMGVDVDLRTVEEMEVFARNKNGKPEALEGQHDDSVITLAIAYYCRPFATLYVPSSHDLASFAISDPMARRQLGAVPAGWSGSGGGFGL